MKKLALLVTIVIGSWLSSHAYAQDIDFETGWIVSAAGNGSVLKLGVGAEPAEHVRLEFRGSYFDGLQDGESQTWGVEAMAKYFVLEQDQLEVYKFSVPAAMFIGLGLGVSFAETNRIDDVAVAAAGFEIKVKPVIIGVEYNCDWTDAMWGGLDKPNHIVLGTITYKFTNKN